MTTAFGGLANSIQKRVAFLKEVRSDGTDSLNIERSEHHRALGRGKKYKWRAPTMLMHCEGDTFPCGNALRHGYPCKQNRLRLASELYSRQSLE